jgi:tRNA/tmRNA/rRNA uracil-C5-methylase (TrmA/RlmC/RlmD family)
VLSEKKFRKENVELNRKEFFESGAEYVSGTVATAVRHFGQLNKESALDFGSGVGRVTIPLAQHFKKVVGVEISVICGGRPIQIIKASSVLYLLS